MQGALLPVPQAEGEHPDEPFQRRLEAPLDDGREHHFRIRMSAKRVAGFFQITPQIVEVVDLAVKDDDEPAVGREHGLMAFRGKVEDGETTVREREARVRIDPHSLVIRSPMTKRGGHPQSLRFKFSGGPSF